MANDHSLTVKVTSIIVQSMDSIPDDMKFVDSTDKRFFSEETVIQSADYVIIRDIPGGKLFEAYTNSEALVCRKVMLGCGYSYDARKVGEVDVTRIIVENPHGKTTHHLSRNILPSRGTYEMAQDIPEVGVRRGDRVVVDSEGGVTIG